MINAIAVFRCCVFRWIFPIFYTFGGDGFEYLLDVLATFPVKSNTMDRCEISTDGLLKELRRLFAQFQKQLHYLQILFLFSGYTLSSK